MRLSRFIIENDQAILLDWVAFTRNQLPAADTLDEAALLDYGKAILEELAINMRRPQGDRERQSKSEGNSTTASQSPIVPSRSHARQRERQGFEVEQMVAEYRALRATVLRLWSASSDDVQVEDLDDVTRFNEAVDQAMSESLAEFVQAVTRARDLFLTTLGHDLRGPLSTISGCAQADLRAHPNNAKQAKVILRSVAQMKALLDDLVEYTWHRLGAGLAIDPVPLQLDQFARNTLDEIDVISPGRTIELVFEGSMLGEWDARRLHQALSNLVFNALKYGDPKTPIRVGLDGTSTEEVVLTVQNSGRPIAPGSLLALFDPLVRAHGEETGGNSEVAGANLGLGLYVVREIARAHGGNVNVTSEESATRFELRLPRTCTRQYA